MFWGDTGGSQQCHGADGYRQGTGAEKLMASAKMGMLKRSETQKREVAGGDGWALVGPVGEVGWLPKLRKVRSRLYRSRMFRQNCAEFWIYFLFCSLQHFFICLLIFKTYLKC